MRHFEAFVNALAIKANWIAAGSIIIMSVLTTLDVILRLFRKPIPGTYEVVGMLGALVVSFSLAYTSIEKGHIAVEFIVQKLSERKQKFISVIVECSGFLFFTIVSWQSYIYALDLKNSGEVSMTLQMPTYPFVLGVAIGSTILTLVLLNQFIKAIKGLKQ
jgi:TRAP-type C4-dicarboxylate transport system permease small subunit